MVTELIIYPYWLPCFFSITHSLIFPGTLKQTSSLKPLSYALSQMGPIYLQKPFPMEQSKLFKGMVKALKQPSVLIFPLLPHRFAKLSVKMYPLSLRP